jgi:hypothetical protein
MLLLKKILKNILLYFMDLEDILTKYRVPIFLIFLLGPFLFLVFVYFLIGGNLDDILYHHIENPSPLRRVRRNSIKISSMENIEWKDGF